ncbi:glycerol-3-phosphate 1-O-acyltransferase PlsY [Mycoplasmoides alvi]|uniref:glycerol-3-phosphate 1-O-acyltransferase PlsY n=1 Tax=Mycoplasmoides alvi TaxID=78580 RepID=UPI000696DAC0|nr:glycerol-3-phosphate 1-O-acyltransferase PlsY [Mycoplasmoides alvi]
MSPSLAIFLLIFLSIFIGYILGSIMTSDVVAFFVKKNARLHWSKNPGTTNSFRVYGKKIGIIVGFGDIFKSFIAFLISWSIYKFLLEEFIKSEVNLVEKVYYLVYLANFSSIVGHCWPIFFHFKGGKAAAPTVGFLMSTSFWWLIIISIVWIIIVIKTKYVSLASLISSAILIFLPLINYIDYLNFFSLGQPFWIEKENYASNLNGIGGYLTYQNDWQIILFLVLNNISICLIIFWKHKENIIRLINHNENKIGSSKNEKTKKISKKKN